MIKQCFHYLRSLFGLFQFVFGLKRRCRFLLIDTPVHENIGDHAIALSERRLLQEWFGKESFFEISAVKLSGMEKAYSRVSPRNQVILVHGGGFLGSIWPNEEKRFRRILDAFQNHKVVVFPQTVTFNQDTDEGLAFMEESVRAYSAHPNLTICCRERRSLKLMQEKAPGVCSILIPDVVLGLQAPKAEGKRDGVLFCMRADREKLVGEAQIICLMNAISSTYPNYPIMVTDTVACSSIPIHSSEQQVISKLIEFSRVRLVVTDRLHGMVFSAITGTPCIALNNSNGKVEAVYEWIADLPYIAFARDVDEAVALIRKGNLASGKYPVEKFRVLFGGLRNLLTQESS